MDQSCLPARRCRLHGPARHAALRAAHRCSSTVGRIASRPGRDPRSPTDRKLLGGHLASFDQGRKHVPHRCLSKGEQLTARGARRGRLLDSISDTKRRGGVSHPRALPEGVRRLGRAHRPGFNRRQRRCRRSGATTVEAAAAQSLSVRVSNGRSAARRGQYSNAWLRMGLRHISR